MKYGYARVSTLSQHLDVQLELLSQAGADIIIQEKKSTRKSLPELEKLLDILKEGDVLITTKLDRISRSMLDGARLIDRLLSQGICINVLNLGILDSSSTSKFVRNILLSYAELERDMIRERTIDGLQHARENGRVGGRPRLYKSSQIDMALEMYKDFCSFDEIQEKTGLSRASVYHYLPANVRRGNGSRYEGE